MLASFIAKEPAITKPIATHAPIDLLQRMIDDMEIRCFSRAMQRHYLRDVERFARFLGRSPDMATADDIRQFQIAQRDAGTPVPTMNNIVLALRFFFTITVARMCFAQAKRIVSGNADPFETLDVIRNDNHYG